MARAIRCICDVVELRAADVIDPPTLKKHLKFHFSVTRDLSRSEVSSNAATFHNVGLQRYFEETKMNDDYQLRVSS